MARHTITDEEKEIRKQKNKERLRLDRLHNPEKYKELYRTQRLKRKDKIREYDRKRYRENKEHVKAICKKSRIKHKNKIYEKQRLDRVANPEKHKLQQQKYLENNPEKAKENRRIWTENNIDKIKKQNREWVQKNKAHINNQRAIRRLDPTYRAKENQWGKDNPEKRAFSSAKRRAMKLNATPKWLTPEHWNEIRRFYRVCSILTRKTGIKYTVDHIHPLQGVEVCGLHVPWNLQILTDSKNASKRNKLLPEDYSPIINV